MPTLHITNGDHAADKLRGFVDGPIALARDVLHEGPCPAVDGDAWHQARGQFLAAYAGRTPAEMKQSLAEDDRTITEACRRGDQLVLWFEHDLFDQLEIIRVLDLAGRANGPALHPRASLICIDRFPGVDRFTGLGQLTTQQLATLTGTGVTVTAGHYKLAADAWRAFRSPDPGDLERLAHELSAAQLPVSEGGPALSFLGDALLRFLAEYPSTATGVSRTEELTLEVLLDGPAAAGAVFGATQAREARPFLGDSTFFEMLQRLGSARIPLVTIDAGADHTDPRQRRIAITEAGRDVIAGRADHVRLNGIDIWRGGVHLNGSDRSPWRWDAHRETLVS